jgi:predicted MFS family arabinose efflux permease
VLAAAIACTFTGAATFTVFTYISPFLTDVAGLPPASISVVLLVFGGAGVFGLVIAAVTSDRRPVVSLVAMSMLLAAAMAALGIAPASTPVAVTGTFVWGLAIGGLPAMLQARMLAVASPALRGTASAMMVVFFNGGIATGALLGAILEQSVGLAATASAASILAVFAIASIVASRMLAGR